MAQQTYRHWQLHTSSDGILWLTLDRQDVSVNSLNREVLTELDSLLTAITAAPPAGVVILSGKTKGFIAGADIKQFTVIQSADEAFDLIRQAQIILDRLSQLSAPTVAMIRGFCLGGGLELALACRYRIAEDSPATQLGLPEVKLGLHPGWGGTVRLPLLIGAEQAMRMMLTGQPVSAVAAAKLGVVDAAVPDRDLERAARNFVLNQPPPHRPTGWARWSNAAWVRPWLGKIFTKKLAQKVNPDHYPAPFAIINNWVRDGAQGEQAMINEARSIAALMVGPTSRELVRVFFLQDKLKAFAKNSRFRPSHVHVIGAGTMGGDIAAWCAYKGFKVTLQDQTPEKIAPAIGRAARLFTKKLEQPRLVQGALDRLQPDPGGVGLAHADVVIEAVFEDLAVKQELFKFIESKAKPEAILATNTSSISLPEIASALVNPQRLMGLHFFNPVAKMMLVEVICPEPVDENLLAQAAGFINQLGHYPLPVASCPGFLINRILTPYLLEAIILHEEGVPIAAIDQAAKDFGMPMGPIELADRIGLDICLSVAQHLAPVYGFNVPQKLTAMVAEKHLGIKSGRGFYRYTREGAPIIHKAASFPAPDLADRLILRLCNEAVACWAEKVVANADLLDAGMIYGAGFAPFRGGPMEYIRKTGPEEIRKKLLRFSEQYGERFKLHSPWPMPE
jgi:3-hydroxyacyl-CoA dehydrogenase / enoyl-CoA hydratase / 3-hydroxybutyryl-CoA epimerase